ncbi:MAG: type II secretion system inner membrane protein GspF [Deltaproteobacteria bacterium]|nr:type II secretion system inner membrane protein GspF [Deltaproteobacteria bacterium]
MPVYRYLGINDKGKKTSGIVDAENERAARTKLRRLNVFPTVVSIDGGQAPSLAMMGRREVRFRGLFGGVKTADLAMMTRQLASLLQANIPLVESLAALTDQLEHPRLCAVLATVRERVTEGMRFADALGQHPKLFNELYINMVHAGESSGTLEQVLSRLADVTEATARLRGRILGAMLYPVIMSIVGVALMIGLLTFVIPRITSLLTEMGAQLPLPTQVLVVVSELLRTWWPLLLVLIVGTAYGLRRWIATPNGREQWDRRMLTVPVIGKLIRLVMIARFTRTLGTLLRSGVPMLLAMDIVRNVVGNRILRRAIEATRDAVKEGSPLAEPLKRSGEFPPLVTHMIGIGEKTGDLERMLERVAETYETQVDTQVGRLMAVMEPTMLLCMGLIVGTMVVSVVLPMIRLSEVAGG